MTEGHGDDIYRYGDAVRYNFSSNILCGVDHAGLMKHLASCMAAISNYPEPEPVTLERRLAMEAGVKPDSVMVTNGATEAIYLIAGATAGLTSAVLQPAFSEYADACRLNCHRVVDCMSLDDIPAEADVVWICNPGNPCGRVIGRAVLDALVASRNDPVFVIDQAYADYTLCQVMTGGEAVDYGNVILLNSLTKRFSVPGLRIGYATGAPRLLARIRPRRMPWSVNGPAIEAARFLLDHRQEYVIDARAMHEEACRLSVELNRLGVATEPTDCNFILCRLPDESAARLKEWLMERHGILIRDASNFYGLTPAHFRVAVQGRRADDILIDALRQWMNL